MEISIGIENLNDFSVMGTFMQNVLKPVHMAST
jgi:hypothetical protein